MPRMSREETRLKIENIRLLMAAGASDEQIMRQHKIGKRMLNAYQRSIRHTLIEELDTSQVIDLYAKHKERMQDLIRRAYTQMQPIRNSENEITGFGNRGEFTGLIRTITECSESILTMGMKLGLIPTSPERYELKAEVAHVVSDELTKLLDGYRLQSEADAENLQSNERGVGDTKKADGEERPVST